jgi:hypothetical protein
MQAGETGFICGTGVTNDSNSKSDDEMNSINYKKWFEEKLIPNTPAGSTAGN